MKTTSVTRVHTNEKILERANEVRHGEKNRNNNDNKQIKSFKDYIQQQNTDILGHIVRAEDDDPMKTA